MSILPHLSCSQFAALECGLGVIAWVIYLVCTTRSRLPSPHHSTKRNGTQAVTH